MPLQHHFEQNFHVAARLDRYNAGHRLPYHEASDPAYLAEAIAKALNPNLTTSRSSRTAPPGLPGSSAPATHPGL